MRFGEHRDHRIGAVTARVTATTAGYRPEMIDRTTGDHWNCGKPETTEAEAEAVAIAAAEARLGIRMPRAVA